MKSLRFLGFLFLLSFGLSLLWQYLPIPGEYSADRMRIEITSGESLRSIAESLQESGVIRSPFLFRLYMQFNELDRSIKPGMFLIPQGTTYQEIASMFTGQGNHETVVTIPEGYTVSQMDDLLASMNLIEAGELTHCAETCDFSSFEFLPQPYPGGHGGRIEGYLFPDTYYVSVSDFVPKFFLERMLGTFRKKVLEGMVDDSTAESKSLHEIMTMASIIERETRTDAERPVVSGILWKRFEAGRGLDADATIRYMLEKWKEPLTQADLQNQNAFNTRRHAGLPPGPIASPGLASIEAALHPAETHYWYYLHGNDGSIHYAETNEEHNANKAKYL